MKRRTFVTQVVATIGGMTVLKDVFAQGRRGPQDPHPDAVKIAMQQANGPKPQIEKLQLPEAEWKRKLTSMQFEVMREEGTERAGTSIHNEEKRKGVFHCAGCDLALFTSEMKYESGTGWPSFFTTLPGVFEKKTDWKLIYPRTEYHCARCGGHHGHVFKDGPAPTNERWCNNGVALVFKPSGKA